MGYIYLITSPDDKLYIGQSIGSIDRRFDNHFRDAKKEDKNTLIIQKIREYNYDKSLFKLEIIEEVDDSKLDEYEEKNIIFYNSLSPNGLNISKGGSGGNTINARINRSNAQRIYKPKGFDLPLNVRARINETTGEYTGFRVDVPNHKAYSFEDSSKTLEENFNLALKQLELIKLGKDNPNENRKKKIANVDDPFYVSWEENKSQGRARAKITNIQFKCEKIFSNVNRKKNPLTKEQLIEEGNKWIKDVLNGKIKPEKRTKFNPEFIKNLGYTKLPNGVSWSIKKRQSSFKGHHDGEITFKGVNETEENLIKKALKCYELYKENNLLTKKELKDKVNKSFN